MKAVTAQHILQDGQWRKDTALLVSSGRIADVVALQDIPAETPCQDFGPGFLAPGFFDVQVNGGGGVLLNDRPDPDGIRTVANAHRKHGTTSLLPTLITDCWDVMQRMADAICEARQQGIPGIRGVHFEGPYLNPDRKGVHDPAHIRAFEEKFIDLISAPDLGAVLVTLAPEKAAPDFIGALVAAGATVAAGHTNATYEQTRAAMQAGLTGFTHLYNAMPPFLSREPGVIGAALESDAGFCGLIVDGFHVHAATLKAAIRAKSASRMMLVTDAMPPAGSNLKTFRLGGQEIHVSNGRCHTADGTLAGSSLTMDEAVWNACDMLQASLAEAVIMASATPAAFMGLDHQIGQLKPGLAADILFMPEGERRVIPVEPA
ncbi:N-acetylglucosamine-6-phosphate deacetylase [Sneathiella chinensis]|uniref:N-acetylglucosamine-6-phosphate deacetylase n=1 Tax=Sneathiella chinensis TaxID=349750 RepID=A0ABQ5U447_9PROT|nr:N-acetylglucosamine-6-phosphate deacetylase [Sneathiella chinensis]GLQ06947.1 N-acetylglucosamine-6-phosphate deacetylase [Sneathiella chinensis]